MSEATESEFQAFVEDLEFLIKTLQESFESDDVEFYIDEQNEALFIKLEGLDEYSDAEIEEIANPVLDELDLDFLEITLMPL